jgi:clan AA aspartic protease
MIGSVDGNGRALLRVRLRSSTSAPETELDVWVDTGFSGELVLPQQMAVSLGLPVGLGIDARLGDGSTVKFDTYTGLLDWFGQWKLVEVMANQGEVPLLGVGLLMGYELRIDYRAGTVSVT